MITQEGTPTGALNGTSTAVFNGRLFGPSLNGAGVAAAAQWENATLILHANGVQRKAVASDLLICAAGFNLQNIQVSWQDANGEHVFFVEQAEDKERFLAAAPQSLTASLQGIQRQHRRMNLGFRSAVGFYGLVLALPLILLTLFLLNIDRIADWAAAKVPIEYEAKIGSMVLAQTRAKNRLVENGPALEAVRSIGGKLTSGSRYSYQWLIVQNNEVNAFAAPGGVIVVHTGLIRQTDSPEELAGVLAHEVAHVELRHSLQGLIKKAGFSLLLSFMMGDWSGSAIGGGVATLTELKFSRDAETEADREGLRRLVKANIDPQPMARFFAKLSQREKQHSSLSMLSTHPASQERMEKLKEHIGKLPKQGYTPLLDRDWAAIKASLP